MRSNKQTQKPLQPNSHGQTDTGSSARTEAHTQQQQAGREASWLKEVRKVKGRVKKVKNETMGDKTLEGGRKSFLSVSRTRKEKGLVQRTEKSKRQNHVLISQHTM